MKCNVNTLTITGHNDQVVNVSDFWPRIIVLFDSLFIYLNIFEAH